MGQHPKDLTLLAKYQLDEGPIVLSGVQALVRLPLVRRRLDLKAGLNTAGFISGYRGSPLGTYDLQLAAAQSLLDQHHIVAKPAVNEDLGATAVWGSQQVNLFEGARYDGVFGIWYGKAPGVDRAGDAFKHANYAGTSTHGGVLAVAGDDHACKSSTLPSQSEYAFADAEIPVFAPADIEEVLTFGLKAFEVSRFAGLWTAMTVTSDLMDSTGSVVVDPRAYVVRAPADLVLPPEGLGIRLSDDPHAMEERHRTLRLPAVEAFVRANGFDRRVFGATQARFGIVAAGKAFADLRQALSDLGVDAREADRLGLAVYKPGLVWPLEPQGALSFVRGLEEVLVVEERRDLVEAQLKTIAYPLPDAQRPRITGKRDRHGHPLLKSAGVLDAASIARAVAGLIPAELRSARMRAHLTRLDAETPVAAPLHERDPFFCPGCPHNTSTVVPDGSRALAGIGCHYMALKMDRATTSVSQMGGEGVAWMGAAPFTDQKHVFVNLGDGTYFHSGVLAIRQAVAAKLPITYKILYNDAVAMTGGQHVDGDLSLAALLAQLKAEGVGRIEVVSDDPERTEELLPGMKVHDRDAMDAVQRDLREFDGVSVLIYDQPCATELRRRRKRGLAAPASSRIFINERVCEDCGDCSAASNCIAVEPVETAFGVKRRIDQSSCNQDTSCVDGFCPSFVSIEGARPRTAGKDVDALIAGLPEPKVPALGPRPTNVVLCGVGGHGVTSLAAIIDHAAHIDGAFSHSIDMLGLAQKGGQVFVHLRLAALDGAISGARIGHGETDLLLANDMVSAHGEEVAPLLSPTRTDAVLSTTLAATAQFTLDPSTRFDAAGMTRRVGERVRSLLTLDAGRIVAALLGDHVYAHMFLLGAAWQSGRTPLSRTAIEKAIALNGVAVEANLKAFALGRLAVYDRAALEAHVPARAEEPKGLAGVVNQRAADLALYQDQAYAARFRSSIDRLARAEQAARGTTTLSEAAARSLYKLMAYKDEYEVARLYSNGAFADAVKAAFEDGGKVSLHLAPPILGKRDPKTGRPLKQSFGPWMLRSMKPLARLKGLRGTMLDPFGRTAGRRRERALRDQFFEVVDELARRVGKADFDLLLEIARAPMAVKGFGHIKDANADAYEARLAKLREAASRVHPASTDAKPQRHTLIAAPLYGRKTGDQPRLRA